MPNIPSHDTFNRVLSQLDPFAWQTCFMSWMRAVSHRSEAKLMCSAKGLRGSTSQGGGKGEAKQAALSRVSAWASENELVLAQLALEHNGAELSVIPERLDLLELEGASVSIDAAACTKAIAEQIVSRGAT